MVLVFALLPEKKSNTQEKPISDANIKETKSPSQWKRKMEIMPLIPAGFHISETLICIFFHWSLDS